MFKCEYCGSISHVPLLNKNQVEVSINWKELIMLFSAAERALIEKGFRPDSLYAIAERVEAQYPLKEPLTVRGAASILKKSGIDISSLNFPAELLPDDDLEKIKKELNWNG